MSSYLPSLLLLIIALLTSNGSDVRNIDYYLQQLDRAAYKGDLSRVIELAEQLQLDWSQLYYNRRSSITAIHHALRGRHDSLATQSLRLLGNHEGVVEYLIHQSSLNCSLGCPLYHAVHYRNTRATELLLRASSIKDIIDCLTTQDVNGETALHAAASSKASGFARFYAKLLTNGSQVLQQSTKQVLQLLDLGYRKSLQLEYLSFEDLTTVIGHRDLTLILKKIGDDFHCETILDQYHNTILHVAAASGRPDLVRMLIVFGCSADQRNLYGQTAPEMAAIAGHQHTVLELTRLQFIPHPDILLEQLPFKNANKCNNYHRRAFPVRDTTANHCELSDFAMKQYLDSGWYNYYKEISNYCDIEHVTNMKLNYYQQHYVGKQPVLVKNLSLQWPAWKHWKRREFIERYGNISVQLSGIPYAELYGFHQKYFTKSVTLTQFINEFNNLSSLRYPPYLFDAYILQQHSELAADIPIPEFLRNFTVTLNQFILGPKGSGSPPHFHRDTINGLVYGIKHWYLWPPNQSFFSVLHIQDWIDQYNSYGNYTSAMECIQLPGDVLYIPNNWGHAVINEEHSIGFAYEFK